MNKSRFSNLQIAGIRLKRSGGPWGEGAVRPAPHLPACCLTSCLAGWLSSATLQ